MFKISALNPLRFIDLSDIDESFDGDFAINQLLSYQNPKCYLQKWQNSDTLSLQVLSDYEPTPLLIRELITNKIISSIEWSLQTTQIVDQTFKVYEISLLMNLPIGKYYSQFSYDDGTRNHNLMSEPFQVNDNWENTLLLRYKNFENDKDVIFDTGIEFQFRVEGAVKYEGPGNNRNVFNDQNLNPTLLSATPFRKFKLFIGFKYGVPFWVQDKVNTIITVNQVSYNNVYYQTPAESEWEYEKDDENAFIGSSIEVYPTDNNFNKYVTAPESGETFIPMQKVLPYYHVSGDIIASGFKNFSNLEKIIIYKRSVNQFTIKLGITEGGSEIGEFLVDDTSTVKTVEYTFTGTGRIYISGLIDVDIDVFIVYKQLDEPPVPVSPIDPPTGLGKGAKMIWEEITPGDLAIYWNTVTGLANQNTSWAGWCWAGTNGTNPVDDTYHVGWNGEDTSVIGTYIGSNTKKILKGNLPAVGVDLTVRESSINSWRVGGGSGRPLVGVGGYNTTNEGNDRTGKSANLGNGEDFNIQPKSLISLWVIKLTD